jgi:CO/xanthine dehydrogenase FAD-binding subunit
MQPDSLEDAMRCLSASGARPVAGGTDFFPSLGDGLPNHDIVDLTRVEGLRGISSCPLGVEFGAATTWTDVVREDLPPAFDGLKAAAREVGSVQIQNSGTLAGNLCNASPAADGVPPLLTLNAELALLGPRRTRRLPLAEFLQGPRKTALLKGEIVTSVCVPKLEGNWTSSFLKLGSRKYLVISIAMVAVLLRMEGRTLREVRISIGACSPVAQRMTALEEALTGQSVSVLDRPGTFGPEMFRTLTPLNDVRGSAEYRLDAVAALCRRALKQAADGGAS